MSAELNLLKAKAQKQKNEIARLNRAIEEARATKADHVFRLRKLLVAALDDHPGWRELANKEIGR